MASNIRTLPDTIWAASTGLAFGSAGYYSQQTGLKLGTLPFTSTIYDANPTTNEVWAFDPATLSLHRYTILDHGVGVLANDTDGDVNTLTAALVTGPAHGTLTLQPWGGFIYVPDAGFSGVDTFTYAASDPNATSNAATVSITVNPPPTFISALAVAVNDSYPTSVNAVLKVTDPVGRCPGRQVFGVGRKTNFALGYGVSQIEYSAAYNLVFVREGTSGIHVIDGRTGADLGTHKAVSGFTDFSVSPDGRYLYVADYGGTNVGYGTPSGTSYVDRYDAATQTWESKPVTGIAYQIEAVDDDRFLLKGIDQFVSITLNSFGLPAATSAAQLATINAGYYGDFAYDPATGRIYMGDSGSSSSEIRAFQIVGNTLVADESTGIYGSAQDGGGSSVLSSDGQNFFYGALQVDAAAVGTNIRTLPETIWAAGGGLAFGSSGYYSQQTGIKLGSLPFASTIFDAFDTANEVWAFDPATLSLHRYVIPDHGIGVLANDTDIGGDVNMLTASLVSGPADGTLTLEPNGLFTYTPTPGFVGNDAFTYQISDAGGSGNTATVAIQVLSSPLAVTVPTAQRTVINEPLGFSPSEGNAIGVTDTDPDAPFNVVLAVDHGSLTVTTSIAGVNINNNGTGQVTLLGNPASVDAVLDTLRLTPQTDFAGDATLQITSSIPSEIPTVSTTNSLVITTYAAPWHNIVNRFDTTNDGVVTARDVLVIINDLLANGSRPLGSVPPAPPAQAQAAFYYIDVNADNWVTPLDALQIINELNAPAPAVIASVASPVTTQVATAPSSPVAPFTNSGEPIADLAMPSIAGINTPSAAPAVSTLAVSVPTMLVSIASVSTVSASSPCATTVSAIPLAPAGMKSFATNTSGPDAAIEGHVSDGLELALREMLDPEAS